MLRSTRAFTEPGSLAKLLAVIRMSREEGGGAIELFAQYYLRERVRQRERREAQEERRFLPYCRVEAVGAADDERRGFAKERGELFRRQVLAAFIKGDEARLRGNPDVFRLY